MRLLVLLLATGCSAFSQTALFHQTFESDTAAWRPLGEGNTVRSTGAAMAFEYTLAPKRLAVLATPAPPELAGAGHLRFSVKADHATAMSVLLMEKKPGGGNYMAWFWAPANEWQAVDLTPADFTVTDGPNDPVDVDGKLDLDAVESIGLLDLAQFFGTLKASGDVPVRIAETAGAHTLLVDRFEIAGTDGAAKSALDRGFLDWVTPGAMNLKLDEKNNPLGERALQVSYEHKDGEMDVLVHREAGDAKAGRLSFDIASEREVTLMLSVEMKKPGGGEGPRFTLPIYPPGGKELFHVDVKLADFEGPGKFDPSRWRTTAIVDVTNADGANTIWISNLKTAD